MSPQPERWTIAAIRHAVRTGALKQLFRRNDVSKSDWLVAASRVSSEPSRP
jgi:hypothetical protein